MNDQQIQMQELFIGMPVVWTRKTTSHWGYVVNFEEIPSIVRSWSPKRVGIETQDDGAFKRVSVKIENLRKA